MIPDGNRKNMTLIGFLNLDKPLGMTSHDCVSKVRRLLKLKRVGHAGTLDPAASGVLPIALGKATRLLQFLPSHKAYQGLIRFGVTTTTDDLEGEILTCHPVPELTSEKIAEVLPQFLGEISQVPPIYSALQVGGKRLYDLARRGEEIQLSPRTVTLNHLEILEWFPGEFPQVKLAISCGSGTYIRSLARDLGSLLNVGGTLVGLTRTESSGFSLENSLTFDQLETQITTGNFTPLSPSLILKHLEKITLNSEEEKRWYQGQRLPLETPSPPPPESFIRVYNDQDFFLGIGQIFPGDYYPILAPKVVI